MTRSSNSIAGCAFLVLAGLSGCSAEQADPVPVLVRKDAASAAKQPAAARTDPADERTTSTVPPSDARVGEDRAPLFARLPEDTLLAVRFPAVERVGEAWRRSALADLLDDPQYAAQREPLKQGIRQLEGELRHQFHDYDALRAQVASLRGELVLALTDFDFLAAASAAPKLPFRAVVLFDAVDYGETMNALLERLVQKHEKETRKSIPCERSGDDRWHRTLAFDGGRVDVVRAGDLFFVELVPGATRRETQDVARVRPLAESFLASPLVRARTDRGAEDAEPVYEVYLHAAPIWDAARLLAPPEARALITAGRFDSIAGLSITSALIEAGTADVMTLHSPGGRDLLSRFVGRGPLAVGLAERIPGDHAQAGLFALDLEAGFGGALALVPERQRSETESNLAQLEADLGFDLWKDLLANLGPTFAVSSRGDLLDAGGGTPELFLAVELEDRDRIAALLEQLLGRPDAALEITTRTIDGARFRLIALPPIPLPDGRTLTFEPTFGIDERAFVLASSPAVIEKARAAARGKAGARNDALLGALAALDPDDWMLSVSRAVGRTPAGTAVGRRTEDGISVETRGGAARTGSGFVTTIPIVASVAIPKLMSARNSANEAAAIRTLRTIYDAEQALLEAARIDVDRDGKGEYGLLEDLCGETPLRGRDEPLDPPALDGDRFADFRGGAAARGGYVYRIDLQSSSTRPVSSVAAAGKVAPNEAETRFVAYAWPLDLGSTGVRAFAVDARGIVFATRNDGAAQGYSGFERPPRADAWCVDEASVQRQFKPDVHLGGDDGTWRRLD